jgi:hypothetical protein
MTESRKQEILEEIRNFQSMIDNAHDQNNPDIPRWNQNIKNLQSELKNG